jgi:hypothetical protein
MAKIGGSLQTPFTGAAKSGFDPSGAGVLQTNGYDIPGGQKGTAGKMPEVTIVSAGSVGNVKTVTADQVANAGKR